MACPDVGLAGRESTGPLHPRVAADIPALEGRSERVEPTNNSSERDLRPSVIHRKVIGAFRSAWGAEASAIRSSILATARKQSRNLLDAFLAIAGPSPLQALPARA